jgi:hypothetical protein
MLVPLASVLVVAGATACASSKPKATRTVNVESPAPTSGPVFLAQFDKGIGSVAAGSATPLWHEPDAVAALDGSAVFTVSHDPSKDSDRLERLDLRRGDVVTSWPMHTPGLAVNAVAPSGRWVALTDRQPGYGSQARTSTTLVVYDTRAGAEVKRINLAGDVQPEAFSIDGALVFALSYAADHYRVQTIQLLTGERYDTTDRDKTLPREDMHGHAVHGVLSGDHKLLATLYRNPAGAKEPAFVHVIDLEHTWSYCADLPAPFGTGPAGTDVIELTAAGTVVVAANSADRLAEIHIDDVRTAGTDPVRVAYRAGTIPPAHPELEAIPGFGYVLATLPA